jgi:DNA-directed RNA polymerase subunit beta
MFTSIHIEEFTTEIHETKVGREEITRDIPGVSETALRNLDEVGLIRIGTKVGPGDILVGKVAPKSKSEYSSEEKLLRAIFGRAGEDIKNDSLDIPPGTEGYVIGVKRFSRRTAVSDEERRNNKRTVKRIEAERDEGVEREIKQKFERLQDVLGGDPVNKRTGKVLRIPRGADFERLREINEACRMGDLDIPAAKREQVFRICLEHDRRIQLLETRGEVEIGRVKRGDELKPGVLEKVKVYVAVKRKLSIGDKMAGRHGNKGVVARVLPEEDMPFLPDGTPVEMMLNPLGVPSRMNVGQILETHLGWAARTLGFRAVTPVFDGASEDEIRDCLREAGLPETGTVALIDGRTGEPLHTPTTVGYMYMLKLHHLVAEKIHARATGPYSLITQQPLGGKARNGGQRFGEMEVWALEAYGAANTLQEILTVKSDDVDGRTKIYESMVKGENTLEPGRPVSFEVLCNEIRGLGLNMRLETNPAFLDNREG